MAKKTLLIIGADITKFSITTEALDAQGLTKFLVGSSIIAGKVLHEVKEPFISYTRSITDMKGDCKYTTGALQRAGAKKRAAPYLITVEE